MKTKGTFYSAVILALALSGFGPNEQPVIETTYVRSPVQPSAQGTPCPYEQAALNGVCVDVRSKDSSRVDRKFGLAACVTTRESSSFSPAERDRFRQMYASLEPTCNGGGLSVNDADLMWYAVSVRNFDFLSIAVNGWCLNLNRMSGDDGITVLDYTVSEMARSDSSRGSLQQYYDELRRGGAMTRREIEASGGNYPRVSTAPGCH